MKDRSLCPGASASLPLCRTQLLLDVLKHFKDSELSLQLMPVTVVYAGEVARPHSTNAAEPEPESMRSRRALPSDAMCLMAEAVWG